MKRLTVVRWSVATAVFLAIGWAMRAYGLNAARLALLALLVLVYVYGGHGRQAEAGAGGQAPADIPPADSAPIDGADPETS